MVGEMHIEYRIWDWSIVLSLLICRGSRPLLRMLSLLERSRALGLGLKLKGGG